MALEPITPRDKLQSLTDLARKTARHWWLIALCALAGGALALSFSVLRAKKYQSWSTLFYQERIQSSLMTPNREEMVQRNIGDRYRELLLARSQLEHIVTDPKLNPFPDESDKELAIDELRKRIRFEARGNNAFRILYHDDDSQRAKAVTAKLTEMLQSKDEELRNDQASRTVTFATQQKEAAGKELKAREQALAMFLAQHPEFAQDSATQSTEGASIRAIRDKAKTPNKANSRLYALERQRQRIQARLDAPPDSAPIRVAAPSAERAAADATVAEAQRELGGAQRELDDVLTRVTDKHPAAIKAQTRVTIAQQKLKAAQAAVPAMDVMVAPATKEDRAKLEQELAGLEKQIAGMQGGDDKQATADATTNWVVKLETEHANLRREVNEQRETVNALAASVFRASIDASSKLAEQGGRLAVVDPAFAPTKPAGPGKMIFLVAGMALFVAIGLGLAVGLAAIDDRIYRRTDLDSLGIGVLAVIPPGSSSKEKSR